MVSPISVGVQNLAVHIEANLHADRPVQRFDTAGLPFRNAAEITEDLQTFYADEPQHLKELCKTDRMLELIAASYGIASKRLRPLIDHIHPEKTGVILGVGADVFPFELFRNEIQSFATGIKQPTAELYTELNNTGTRLNRVVNPYDLYAIYLAQKFNAAAFQKSILTACVSSTQALAFGFESIQNGEAEVVVAGGTDSLLNVLALASFGKLGVIAETTEEPCCRPFDLRRNGTLAGECAGFAVLVSESFVQRTGIRPKAQLLGYGNTLDAYKITAPDPEGTSITRAIQDALKRSGLKPGQIDYINAHGTGTKHNDQLELSCLRNAFGAELNKIPISSTKSRHGHAIAAAGIQEFCLLLEMLKHQLVPGNLFMKSPCDTALFLPTENIQRNLQYGMTTNFAFGGVNTVLVVKKESE